MVPPVSTPAFVQVVTLAGRRCQCGGVCGREHRDGAGRCTRGHEKAIQDRLYAAPADPTVPAHQAYRVPLGALSAWCGPCLDAARRRARQPIDPATVPDSLFKIDTDTPGGAR